MLTVPFCGRGFGVGFGYLNTEPNRVFGALGNNCSHTWVISIIPVIYPKQRVFFALLPLRVTMKI